MCAESIASIYDVTFSTYKDICVCVCVCSSPDGGRDCEVEAEGEPCGRDCN